METAVNADAAVPAPTSTAGRPVPTRQTLILALLLMGQFMSLLDNTIVNVAMRTISADLHASGAQLQLIVSGYTVSYAVLLITGARLGTLLGRKRLFLSGLAIFTLSSLACGLAPNATVLVLMRFAQGIGAAAMVPQVLSTINTSFTGPERSRALGGYSAVIALGAVCGQVLGGILVSADIAGSGWRPIFLVNVPIGVVLSALVSKLVPDDRPAGGRRLDVAGLLLAVPAVLLIVLPLVLGHEYGWPLWCIGAIAAGVILAGVFVAVERRILAGGGDPLLDVRVVRIPGLGAGLITVGGVMAAYGGSMFALSLHLQEGLGDSALRAGLIFAPAALLFGAASLYWRRIPAAAHHTLSAAGLIGAAVSVAGLAALLHGGSDGGAGLWLVLMGWGLAQGVAFGSLMAHALAEVPPERAADASGLLTTTTQLGNALGTAVFGSIFLSLDATGARLDSAHAFADTWWTIAAVFALCSIGGALLGRSVLRLRRAAAV
ncbi:MAG: MFS transporter [Mycobacteriales bacterium]